MGLPDIPKFDLSEERIDEMAEKIVNEPFARLSPVKVDKAAAMKIIKESFDV